MTTLAITKRPVVLEMAAGQTMLSDILARIETAAGRASLYGFTDPVAAKLFASETVEADFAGGFYRRGYLTGTALTNLSSWTFARTGAGMARTAGGGLRSFATGVPRITDRGLLVEAAATNLWRYSEDFTNAAWSKGASSIVGNAGVSPDGATTADKLVENTANTTHFVSQTTTSAKAMSVYAKAAGRSWIAFQHGSAVVSFNLSGAGAVGTSSADSARIEALENGWYRCVSIVNTPANDTRAIFLASADNVRSYLGDGASGVLLFGAQVEADPRASSYILTTSATATRGADLASFQAASASEGGLFVEADLPSHLPVSPVAWQTLSGWTNGTNTHVVILRNPAGALVAALLKPSGNVSITLAGFTTAQRVKAFVGWGNGKLVFNVNGASAGEVDATAPGTMATVRPGNPNYDADPIEGYVRRLLVTTRLPTLAQRNAMTAL